ncbi:E3 ubiquitin-protein ligase rnf213-alpha-like [Labrus bergylta]|uniref:E3 ubiquitin-protein ligase rnf213-alpha-like n=1 Tax=Labrus bergylta TaxID=56723 RepID=UPI003313A807
MFCPDCGNQVQSSFRFCPDCGYKLFLLTQNKAEDVATSANQPSVTAEEKNQKEDQDQVPKDVKEDQENRFQKEPASDDQEPAKDGTTSQDGSDKNVCPAKLENGARSYAADLTFTYQPDTVTKDNPDEVNTPADKPSDILSLSTCVLSTSAKETSSTSSDSCDQTTQECGSVTKQSSANQPSVTAEEKNQKEDQDQVPKDVKEDQENQFQKEPASDDQEPAKDGTTSQDGSDKNVCPAKLENGARSYAADLTFTYQPDTVTKDNPDEVNTPADKPSDILSLSTCVLSTSAKETSSTSSDSCDQTTQECGSVTKQSASDEEKNETQNLPDRPDGNANWLDDTQRQTASDDLESARDGATPQDTSDSTASPATQEKGALSSSSSETVSGLITTQKSEVITTCKEAERLSSTAPDSTLQPYNEQHLSGSKTLSDATPASYNLTEQQAEAPDTSTNDNPDEVQLPADKPGDIHSGPLSNPASVPTLTKETSSTAPEPTEQRPQECDSVTTQSNTKQEKEKKTFHETQIVSKRRDDNDNKINKEQRTLAKQTDKKKDQASRKSAASHSVSKKAAKGTKAVETKSNKKISTHPAEKQEQQPGDGDVDKYTSPMHSCPPSQADEKLGPQGTAHTSQIKATQMLPKSESIDVYFHAVTSKDLDPEDEIFLMSRNVSGQWGRIVEMTRTRALGGNRSLVEGQTTISKNMINKSMPYKYAIYKAKHGYKEMYETIYQKDGNEYRYVNRCLTVREEFLTREGDWHQYDDVIHSELKTSYWSGEFSTKDVVMKGRDLAGRVMLNIIFELLTTWNEQNVDNFFLLLRQFFHTYSYPVLHDDMERSSGLPYGPEQVKNLLKCALDEHLNPKPGKKKEYSLHPLYVGVVRLLIYDNYLKDDMKGQMSSLCDLLCLPKHPQHHFKDFWEKFAGPLPDKNRIADAVEMLCNNARKQRVEKWFLVIPLIHLLRGKSRPFEPVPPVLNPKFDSWSKGTNVYRDNNAS